jgi:hypothetical protein
MEKKLPPIEEWYNALKGEPLDAKIYEKCLEKFKSMSYFWQYMMYYCERDVDLLLRGWKNFQNYFLTQFQLDPCNYMSVPQLGGRIF